VARVQGACDRFAQHVFELDKDPRDRVQVGRIFQPKDELDAARTMS
jgi:hypothetical protein